MFEFYHPEDSVVGVFSLTSSILMEMCDCAISIANGTICSKT